MSELRVAFRADAGTDIGLGHVARCLTLADALVARGSSCLFVCREHEGHALDRIRERGHEAVGLQRDARARPFPDAAPRSRAAWLGVPWSLDAEETRRALGPRPFDWLVVDHYGIDAPWERTMRGTATRVMVIDDLTDRSHDCDLLLDQSPCTSPAARAATVPVGCRTLVGPGHALLRPTFAAARAKSLARRADRTTHELLVTMGGVDRDDATGAVLGALDAAGLAPEWRVTVVLGAGAPRRESVRDRARASARTVEVRVDERDMAAVMSASDLCIGAAGGTAWERCCVGLPSIVVTLADNQRAVAAALDGAGAAATVELPTLVADLARTLARPDLPDWLCRTGERAAALVDGLGTGRVAEALLGPVPKRLPQRLPPRPPRAPSRPHPDPPRSPTP